MKGACVFDACLLCHAAEDPSGQWARRMFYAGGSETGRNLLGMEHWRPEEPMSSTSGRIA